MDENINKELIEKINHIETKIAIIEARLDTIDNELRDIRITLRGGRE